jgi:hypothetical protein
MKTMRGTCGDCKCNVRNIADSSAYSQHPMAIALGPPYVYPYHGDNDTALIEAIQAAMKVNINRLYVVVEGVTDQSIPPYMQKPFVRGTVKSLLETNFTVLAQEVITANKGVVPSLPDHIRTHLLGKQEFESTPSGHVLRWVDGTGL